MANPATLYEGIAGSELYTEILSWMFRCQDIPLLGHGNMGIDFRNVDGAVSKHLLDIADINISLQQTCGKGVPEHVWGDVQVDGGKNCVFVDNAAYRLVRQDFAILIGEEMATLHDFGLKITFVFD